MTVESKHIILDQNYYVMLTCSMMDLSKARFKHSGYYGHFMIEKRMVFRVGMSVLD